jgi:hypothetical protein
VDVLYESADRTEEALSLNVTDLDTAKRCVVMDLSVGQSSHGSSSG